LGATALSFASSNKNDMANMNLELIARGRTAEVFTWEPGKVIKVYLKEFPPEDARYEADIAAKVRDSGVACPRFFGQTEVDGRPGLIYERIDGVPMAELVLKSPWRIPEFARRMAALHVQMHKPVITASLPAQREKFTHRIETSKILPVPLKQALLMRLAELPDDRRLCHGDFHPGNIISTAERDLAIDWIDVSIGHPMADVARTSILLLGTEATIQNPFIRFVVRWFNDLYLKEYFRSTGDKTLYRAFIPIVAAARIAENIPELQDWLLKQTQKV
jgi:uncharacterized protein (TIGR02172 family)